MNKTNLARGVAAAALLLITTTACSSESDNTIAAPDDCTTKNDVSTIKEGVLTVAAVDVPPVSSTAGDKFTGLEPTLVRTFAEDNCLSVNFETMSFAATIPAIQSSRADVAIGGYYRTAERAEVVDLSDPVWMDQMAIYSKDDLSSVADLEGRKVGTVDGYLWVSDLKEVLGADLTVYGSAVDLKADLAAGRIDVAIDSLALAAGYDGYQARAAAPDERVASTVNPAQVGFPFTKGNESLGKALNDAIARWHGNGSVAKALEEAGMPDSLGDVGAPQLIQ